MFRHGPVKPASSQPPAGTAIDWSNPNTAGLLWAMIPTGSSPPINAATGQPMAYGLGSNDFYPTITTGGPGYLSRNSSSYQLAVNITLAYPPGITYIAAITPLVAETDGTTIVGAYGAGWNIGSICLGDGTNPRFQASFYNGSTTQYITAPSNFVVGQRYLVCVQSSATQTALWIDGVLVGYGGALASQGNNNQQPSLYGTASNGAYAVDAYMGFASMIPANQVISLMENPWRVFPPRRSRIWITPGSGVTVLVPYWHFG